MDEAAGVNADPVVIIGAGPAGLTAAYELGRHGRTAVVLEADSQVGGISRTVERDGWRFDLGGHRFFTKVQRVEDFWHEILPPEDFLMRPRMSRIFYNGKFYDYPLRAKNALFNLGVWEATLCVGSYAAVRIKPPADQTNFEGWVASRFGWRCIGPSSRPTPRRCGGSQPTTFRRTGRLSASRTCRSVRQ